MRDGFQEGIAMILKSEVENQAAEALEVEKSGKAKFSDKAVEDE